MQQKRVAPQTHSMWTTISEVQQDAGYAKRIFLKVSFESENQPHIKTVSLFNTTTFSVSSNNSTVPDLLRISSPTLINLPASLTSKKMINCICKTWSKVKILREKRSLSWQRRSRNNECPQKHLFKHEKWNWKLQTWSRLMYYSPMQTNWQHQKWPN